MSDFIAFAEQLAKDAAVIAQDYFKVGVAAEKKSNNTPVTEADIKINQLVLDRVAKEYLDHGVIGEELSNNVVSDYVWVVDPIDGTTPFTFGLPYSCFSLALCLNGEPIVAVCYDFGASRMYSAEKGQGAYRDGGKIMVNDHSNLKMCIISESSKTSSYVDTPLLRKLSEERCHRLLILQCAVQEGLLVANGQTAGGIFVGSTAHDVAATKLIIEEAGGKTSDLFGNDQSYDTPVKGFVYSNGIVHNELLELVNDSLIKRVV